MNKKIWKTVRGGSWYYFWNIVRPSYRLKDSPSLGDSLVGFRCVRRKAIGRKSIEIRS